jgi:hypothetical protein
MTPHPRRMETWNGTFNLTLGQLEHEGEGSMILENVGCY